MTPLRRFIPFFIFALVGPPSILKGAEPATRPAANEQFVGIAGSEVASIDDDIRFQPTTRPALPAPQHPPKSTPENVDTGRPFWQWQRPSNDWFGLRPKLEPDLQYFHRPANSGGNSDTVVGTAQLVAEF